MVPRLFSLHPVSVTKRKWKASGMQESSQALSQQAVEGSAPQVQAQPLLSSLCKQ